MNIYAGWPALVLRHHRAWLEDLLDTGREPIVGVSEADIRPTLAAINAELARQTRQSP